MRNRASVVMYLSSPNETPHPETPHPEDAMTNTQNPTNTDKQRQIDLMYLRRLREVRASHKLGERQASCLRHLSRSGSSSGWCWDNASTSERVLQSLERRSLVIAHEQTYRQYGRSWTLTHYAPTALGTVLGGGPLFAARAAMAELVKSGVVR